MGLERGIYARCLGNTGAGLSFSTTPIPIICVKPALVIKYSFSDRLLGSSPLRACDEISEALRRERRAGRCKAPRRRRCGVIVEERQHRRCPPAAAPLRAAARRLAGCVARSLHTTRYARRSRLASGPGGLQRSASLISSQALTPWAMLSRASSAPEELMDSACDQKANCRRCSNTFSVGRLVKRG